MAKPYYQMDDNEFDIWYENLSSQAQANAAGLGPAVTPARITQTQTNQAAYHTQLLALKLAEDALAVEQDKMRQLRTTGNEDASFYNATLKANTAYPTTLIEALGFEPNKKPSRTSPTVPLNLSATGASNGDNTLKWERNGNNNRTLFTVEFQVNGTGAWLVAGSTTKLMFVHSGQTPGVQVVYRVYASRNDERSSISNTAIVYPKG